MSISFRNMTIGDYDELIKLFENTPGISLRDADSYNSTKIYLERNPDLSFVAICNNKIIGCLMCGHDGRRGYLQHLLVIPEFRNQGIGKQLVEMCLHKLKEIGILKNHLFVLKSNNVGNKFWNSLGWNLREDINMFSFTNSENLNV